ncbi:hypothetical protein [Paenibacillus sp. ISL-20]|uniref:hypothetical protein n=1 Tax=Paenibacillus sp. ISL-20 TaxID=2819163 RepID=UPI001BE6F897|nr:hypothetical protein [Paenibacillus sp. ISL-20]
MDMVGKHTPHAVSLFSPEGYDLLQTAGIGKLMANSPIELQMVSRLRNSVR